jgi:HSP20 family protein
MAALIRTDDPFSDLVRRFMAPTMVEAARGTDMPIELRETETRYTLQAEIPGARREDIQVSIEGRRVSITARFRPDPEEAAAARPLLRETRRIQASRSLSLAWEIDEPGAAARFENGVLMLTLPKRTGAQGRQLPVR